MISICIPTHDYDGLGSVFFDHLLGSVKKQKFKDFEVCVSDHSPNKKIKDVCDKYSKHFIVRYFHKVSKVKSGASNTNSVVSMARGDIIKIMFCDDFFVDNMALRKISCSMSKSWLVCGCNHFQDGKFTRTMIPRWNDKIFERNTISSPSVLAYKNVIKEEFDVNLKMLWDVEFYYRLMKKYGPPVILNDILVSNRIHKGQVSSQTRGKVLGAEKNYCYKKHGL